MINNIGQNQKTIIRKTQNAHCHTGVKTLVDMPVGKIALISLDQIFLEKPKDRNVRNGKFRM